MAERGQPTDLRLTERLADVQEGPCAHCYAVADERDQLKQLKKEQFNLRFQQATGQLEKTARVKEVRRDIARVKTILREKAEAGQA